MELFRYASILTELLTTMRRVVFHTSMKRTTLLFSQHKPLMTTRHVFTFLSLFSEWKCFHNEMPYTTILLCLKKLKEFLWKIREKSRKVVQAKNLTMKPLRRLFSHFKPPQSSQISILLLRTFITTDIQWFDINLHLFRYNWACIDVIDSKMYRSL
jgi:hypothetical protein